MRGHAKFYALSHSRYDAMVPPVLLRAHLCLSRLMSAQVVKKKWPLHIILPISWSIFHKIKRKWTLLKSAWERLLKNIQDGISGPLGG